MLITALSICIWPTGALAGDPPAPGDHSSKTAAVSQPAEAPSAKAKAFIHPETGEVLTREEWQSLGLESDEAEAVSRSSSDDSEPVNTPTILKGRQIDLGNGDYVIVVDAPESEMVETKVWFDEKGKAHIRCDH